MKLNVNIEYRTSWGESLVLCMAGKRYPLSYVGEGLWEVEIARITIKSAVEYSYEVVRDGQTIRTEWKKHVLVLPVGSAPKVVSVNDRWNDRPADAPFYSSAFTKAIFGRGASRKENSAGASNLMFQVNVANVRPDEVLAIAKADEKVAEAIAGKTVVKEIVVPNKIVNIVVK